MLSRGKLVQDWQHRLAAAEAEGQEEHRLRWLYRMRVRLYRFLLSCYRQGDWRADEPSLTVEETLADVPRGDTTTLLDCPLDGKPAKNAGKMQAVLKSVSAAQDHPPAGPLLGGIAADEWVVAVSVRDKLKMAGCQELLRQFGITSKWTLLGEIKVRLFDLQRATKVIRDYRETLVYRPQRVSLPYAVIAGRATRGEAPTWAVRFFFVCVFLAPLYALVGLLLIECGLAMVRRQLLSVEEISSWLVICYFVGMQLALLTMFIMDWRRRDEQRKEARRVAERMRDRN